MLLSPAIRRHSFVFASLVAKSYKTTYRNMALGVLWSLVNPLVLVAVLSAVWLVFFAASRQFPAFVAVALIPFNFSGQCLRACAQSVVGNASLVKKVAFPRQLLPFAAVATSLADLALQIPLVVAVLLVFPPPGRVLAAPLLWLPAIFALHLLLVAGTGLLVAGANVLYRDVRYLLESVLVVLFWASPILYDAHDRLAARPGLALAYYLNPCAGLLESYRRVLYEGAPPHPVPLAMAFGTSLLLAALGLGVFGRLERDFADLL
ncbi:MAG: ABC transporter permease [Planctomycetota bacterium]